jgi:mannan endo-1,4-beta-mannosidase
MIVARWCLGLLVALCFCAGRADADSFVTTQGTQFVLDGQPFYVTGVNNHYLSWGTDVEVTRVLDDAVAMGANVVRTFLQPVIGAPDGSSQTIWHSLGPMSSDLNTHGLYLLYWDPAKQAMAIHVQDMAQIDRLLAEAGKRHLKLILAFMDFWAYTGGAYQMSSWYDLPTHQGAPYDTTNLAFFTDARVLADYQRWVKFVVERINSVTKIAYRDDSTIFAWELMNEPMPQSPCTGSGRLRWRPMSSRVTGITSLERATIIQSSMRLESILLRGTATPSTSASRRINLTT